MALYDICKAQMVIADTSADKEMYQRLYHVWFQLLKGMAEDYQVADNAFNHLVSQMLDLNMPHKPNPLQSWHHVSTKVDGLYSNQLKMISDLADLMKKKKRTKKFKILGTKSPKIIPKSQSEVSNITTGILKSVIFNNAKLVNSK